MDNLDLLIDLHIDGARQGPGSAAATRRAMEMAGLTGRSGLRIADIGCGTGASSLQLARELDAQVTAVDFLPAFLDRLRAARDAAGLGERIAVETASMEDLPFEAGRFDAIWSEGAIYNMGFENGIRAWKRFLKPGGVLAVSELSWLTGSRPADLQAHWEEAYAEVATASVKIAQLEAAGYAPIGYFPLPEEAWRDEYYGPLQTRFEAFLARHGQSAQAQALIASEREEIALYERHAQYYGYGFYLARALAG